MSGETPIRAARPGPITAVLALALSALTATVRADFALGVQAFAAEDYARAALEFSIDAHKGHAEAQVNLGLLYEHGLGMEQDLQEAFRWYRTAAMSGNVLGQLNLAALHFEGIGTEQSYEQAAEWYQRAAMAGDGTAQYNLSVMYEEGLGIEPDLVQAWAWRELAARQDAFVSARERGILEQKLTADEREAARKLLEHYQQRYPATE